MSHNDIEAQWQNDGETLSIQYKDLCYHFRKKNSETVRTAVALSTVDVLDTDQSMPGQIVKVPSEVATAVEAKGCVLIE